MIYSSDNYKVENGTVEILGHLIIQVENSTTVKCKKCEYTWTFVPKTSVSFGSETLANGTILVKHPCPNPVSEEIKDFVGARSL